MSIFGDGTQIRVFTHINDAAPIIAESVNYQDAGNEIFIVGADLPYAVNRLAQFVASALGKERCAIHLDERKEVKIAFSDRSKVERFFGRKEKSPLESGIRSMAEWVRRYGAAESSNFET